MSLSDESAANATNGKHHLMLVRRVSQGKAPVTELLLAAPPWCASGGPAVAGGCSSAAAVCSAEVASIAVGLCVALCTFADGSTRYF